MFGQQMEPHLAEAVQKQASLERKHDRGLPRAMPSMNKRSMAEATKRRSSLRLRRILAVLQRPEPGTHSMNRITKILHPTPPPHNSLSTTSTSSQRAKPHPNSVLLSKCTRVQLHPRYWSDLVGSLVSRSSKSLRGWLSLAMDPFYQGSSDSRRFRLGASPSPLEAPSSCNSAQARRWQSVRRAARRRTSISWPLAAAPRSD
ncbi:hypothetical protein B0J14DRAFT_689238 [Halenospora varia]|nr:hypothetical protein B0J14DRAFT_689238 [Halenospora varia]